MTTFTAKSKSDLVKSAEGLAGEKIPEADPERLRYMGEGKTFSYEAPFKHTLRDVLRPNYFRKVMFMNANSYLGALIWLSIPGGKRSPADWGTVLARVSQVSGGRGTSPQAPTLIAIVRNFGKATEAAHDGEPDKRAA